MLEKQTEGYVARLESTRRKDTESSQESELSFRLCSIRGPGMIFSKDFLQFKTYMRKCICNDKDASITKHSSIFVAIMTHRLD